MAVKQTEQQKSDATLEQVKKQFDSFWEYVSNSYHQNWERYWKLYNNQRTDKFYNGITNTFVPMTHSTIETIVSALSQGKPKFSFVPASDSQDTDVKVLNALLDYYWDCDKWSSKTIQWLRDILIYGTGVLYIYWDIDKPRLLNIPVRDFIFDPLAPSPEEARYLGRRYLTTKDKLREVKIVDPETKEMVPRFKNIDKIPDNSTRDSTTDKEVKDMLMGSTVADSDSNEEVEVIEIWTNDTCRSIANRTVVIEDVENIHKTASKEDYKLGFKPFIIQRNYTDGSLLLGKSEIEPFALTQELLNDLTNQNIDAISYITNPMYTVDPRYTDIINSVENLPGAVYPFEAGTMQRIQMGQLPPDAFQERQNLKNEIRETSSADEIVKGVGQANGNVTATEVNAQIGQSAARFGTKITQLENEGFHDLAKMVFTMMKAFINKPQAVRIISAAGIDWQQYDPKEFTGDYEPRVQLELSAKATDEKQKAVYKDFYTANLDNPFIDQMELTRFAMQKIWDLEPDEVDELFKDPREDMNFQMTGEGMPGEAPINVMGDQNGQAGLPGAPEELPSLPQDTAVPTYQ